MKIAYFVLDLEDRVDPIRFDRRVAGLPLEQRLIGRRGHALIGRRQFEPAERTGLVSVDVHEDLGFQNPRTLKRIKKALAEDTCQEQWTMKDMEAALTGGRLRRRGDL